jgi:hypothetical protein
LCNLTEGGNADRARILDHAPNLFRTDIAYRVLPPAAEPWLNVLARDEFRKMRTLYDPVRIEQKGDVWLCNRGRAHIVLSACQTSSRRPLGTLVSASGRNAAAMSNGAF